MLRWEKMFSVSPPPSEKNLSYTNDPRHKPNGVGGSRTTKRWWHAFFWWLNEGAPEAIFSPFLWNNFSPYPPPGTGVGIEGSQLCGGGGRQWSGQIKYFHSFGAEQNSCGWGPHSSVNLIFFLTFSTVFLFSKWTGRYLSAFCCFPKKQLISNWVRVRLIRHRHAKKFLPPPPQFVCLGPFDRELQWPFFLEKWISWTTSSWCSMWNLSQSFSLLCSSVLI